MSAHYPCGLSEPEILAAIEQALSNLGKIYRFGYHEQKDIEQEGRMLALEILQTGKYDCKRSLPAFLFVHLRNRLSNFKRDKFRRNDPPCKACHYAFNHATPSVCSDAEGGTCKKYESWRLRNASKQNLMNMLDLSVIDADSDYLAYDEAAALPECEAAELAAELDAKLPAKLRKVYLKIKSGEKVSKTDRKSLEEFVRGNE